MKKKSPGLPDQMETLHRYLDAEQRLKEDRRFFFTIAIGIALLQLTRIPAAGYRPLMVFLPGVSFRYSLFGDIFLLLALRRPPGTHFGEGFRLFCGGGVVLYTFHALTSFGDHLGLFGTPALLEAAAFWYPSLLALFLLPRLRFGTGHFLAAGSLLTATLGSLTLFFLNIAGLLFSLTSFPGIRLLFARVITGSGIQLGALTFVGGALQAALFLYFRLRQHALAPEYKQLEARVYLDKKRKI